MSPLKALAALVLLFAVCDVTSAQLGQRSSSLFGRFFNTARRTQSQPQCSWLSNPSLLKELKWKEQVDLCFETGPLFQYPANDVAIALQNDPAAAEFLGYLTSCYNYRDQTYFHGWDNTLYSQDLCPVRPRNVEMVYRMNHIDNRMDHCYIVNPDQQRVAMAQCGDGLGHPESQKCKRDSRSYFQGNYYCIPDGYVKRTVLIYCPWDPEVQCIPAQVRIPTGCSCKQYTCDKVRAANAAGALSGLSAITSRFSGK
ncbi:uncharacterized protein [Littorina saxatilis]|uniref:Uncharacterized protein n=1 Tax=Littorina saxatilis TaxID=31220 RepID=A0AAN9BLC4_9CAEN